MTTFVTVANTEIDQDSPVTQPLVTALRDNPIAIAEADSSVALSLRPTVSLGSVPTTSGSTVSLSSLDLTPYRFLTVVLDDVSTTAGGILRIDGQQIFVVGGASVQAAGHVRIDLTTGVGASVISQSAVDGEAYAPRTSLSNASTSVSLSCSSGTFDAGSFEVFGEK